MFFHHKNPDQASNMFVMTVYLQRFSNVKFSSLSDLKKGGNFKIIFPFPYPIIYNPDNDVRTSQVEHQ